MPFSCLLPLELTRSAFFCDPTFHRKHLIPLRDSLLHSLGHDYNDYNYYKDYKDHKNYNNYSDYRDSDLDLDLD